jgi:hypothetical protein
MATAVEPQQQQLDSQSDKKSALTCICCRLLFANANEQRDHYRTDLHNFNLV